MNKLYGVVNGIKYLNIERDNELNKRIFSRNISSHTLEPQFTPRPVPTKYCLMPILDKTNYDKNTTKINSYKTYNIKDTFNPGTSSPWSGYVSNLNTENILRNQVFPLQNNIQSKYIPSMNSDLYNNTKLYVIKDDATFDNFNPNKINIGKKTFNNHTRQQIKNL